MMRTFLAAVLATLVLIPAPVPAVGPIKIFQEAEVELPAEPVSVGVRPGSTEVWVSLEDGSLVVIDAESHEIIGRVPDVGTSSWGLAFHPDGSLVYGTSWLANELAVVDADGRAIRQKIAVGLKPAFVQVAPDGGRVWVSNFFSGELSVVDLARGTTLEDVDVGRRPMGLAVGPLGRWAYLASGVADVLTVVDLETNQVARTRPVDFASTLNMGLSRDGSKLVAPGTPNFLLVFDPNDPDGEIRKIQVGQDPVGVALGPWDRYAFVSNYRDANISVVDLQTERQVQTYPTRETPMFLTLDPEGRRLYVCSNEPKVLSIFSVGDPETGLRPTAAAASLPPTAEPALAK